MFYSESNYAYVSDGNVRLLVFPPAVERGSLIGLLWSDINEVKELVALQLDDILTWPFDVHDEEGRTGQLTLNQMFPPANSIQEWIPVLGAGWYGFKDGRHFLRVSPMLTPILGGEYEYCFLLFDAMDNSLVHWPASSFWIQNPSSAEELMEKLSSAASDFQAMSQRLNDIDQGA